MPPPHWDPLTEQSKKPPSMKVCRFIQRTVSGLELMSLQHKFPFDERNRYKVLAVGPYMIYKGAKWCLIRAVQYYSSSLLRTLQSAHVGWFTPWLNYVFMFLGKTHYCYNVSLHPGTWMIKHYQISIFRWRAAVLHVASFKGNWEKLWQLWATARKP